MTGVRQLEHWQLSVLIRLNWTSKNNGFPEGEKWTSLTSHLIKSYQMKLSKKTLEIIAFTNFLTSHISITTIEY